MQYSDKIRIGIIIAVMLVSVLGNFAYAQTVQNPPAPAVNNPTFKITFANPFKENTIYGLITTIINDILMPIGGVIAVVMIIYAGFKYVTAGGNTTQIAEATKALQYAVIGAAILLGAWVIANAIKETIDELKK
jgi:hypothetical protein